MTKIGKHRFLLILSILWLILICWVAYGWNLGSIGLIDETEPLFAEASRQMFVTGDWITPFFDGETRFDKPALIYWCQAIAYSILGVNEWAVRLPSAIAATGLISLGFYTIQRHLAQEVDSKHSLKPWLTAALGASVMALNPEMIIWGRTGVSDMLLTGCMGSALLCFFLGYSNNNQSCRLNKWYLAFYVLIAGAILTKGPVGIVLPGLIIGIFLFYLGNLRKVLQEMNLVIGTLIVLGLSVPWYALVIWRNGWAFINSFFGYHNLERFTEVVNGHAAPWYFYFVVVLLCFAPYSIYLPVAMSRLKFWQRKHWCAQERSRQLGLFAFFWFMGVFCFFTIAVTKLPSYILPLMPPSAILVALLWNDLVGGVGSRGAGEAGGAGGAGGVSRSFFLWSGWVNVVFLSALAIALFEVPRILGPDPAAPNLRQLLIQSGLPALGGVILLCCALVLAFILIRRFWHSFIIVNLLTFVAFLVFVLTPSLFLMDQQRQLPLRELSAIAVQAQKPGEQLVMVGFKKPSVVFYTRRSVTYIKEAKTAAKYIQEQSIKKAQPLSVLLLSQPTKFPQIGLQPTHYENLAAKGAYQLIRVPIRRTGHGA